MTFDFLVFHPVRGGHVMFANSVVGPVLLVWLFGAEVAKDVPEVAAPSSGAALLHMARRVPVILADESQPLSDSEFRSYKNTQAALMKSNGVLQAVLQRPEIRRLPSIADHKDDSITWLKEHLVVEFPGDAELMQISFTGAPPSEGTQIVNAVSEDYLQEVVNAEYTTLQRTHSLLDTICKSRQADLHKRRDELHQLERVVGQTETAEVRKRLLVKQLDGLSERRNQIQNRIHELKLQLDLIAKGVKPASDANLSGELDVCMLHLAELDNLIEKQVDRIDRLSSYSAVVETKRMELERLTDHIKQLDGRLKSMSVNLHPEAERRIRRIQTATAP
jgi:hypothetical protein